MLRTAPMMPDRSRAELDPRWDQAKISGARLVILGSSLAGQLAAVAAAGLGFRQIVLMGTGEERTGVQDKLWADLDHLRLFVKNRYTDVLFSVLSSPLPVRLLRELIGEPDACLAVPDDPHSSEAILSGSSLVDAPKRVFLRARAKGVSMTIGRAPDSLPLDTPATTASALLGAGLALSEVRRLVAPCADDCEPEDTITFQLPSLPQIIPELRMAGAGGTGTMLGLACRSACNGLQIWDADLVEPSNLPRCPWLSTVGRNKATDLAGNLLPLTGRPIRMAAHECHAGPDWLDDTPPGCVAAFSTDSLASRKILNSAVCRRGVRAVNLGTSLFGASVYTIGRGSACLECRFPSLGQRIAAEASVLRRSCGRRPEAAAAISNMIAAGAAGMIAVRLPDPGFSFPGVFNFDAFDPARIWVDSEREDCGCSCQGGERDAVAAA